MKSLVLIIVGLPGSGKTTASLYFQSKKIPVFRMGQITDDMILASRLSASEKNEKLIRERLRKEYGEDIYARKIVEKIRPLLSSKKLIVIDGMRSRHELNYFKQNLPDVRIIFLEAETRKRHERLAKRRERPLTLEEAKRRDMSELETLGIHTLRKSADFVVKNEGAIDDLYKKLETIMTRLNL